MKELRWIDLIIKRCNNQILAKPTIAIETNTKTLCPKSSRFLLVKMMDRGWDIYLTMTHKWSKHEYLGPIRLESTSIRHIRLKYRYSTRPWVEYGPTIRPTIRPQNIGRIPVLFGIAKRGWVICQSLVRMRFWSLEVMFINIVLVITLTLII